MNQFELPMRPAMMPVDDTQIAAQPTLTGATILCATLSGKNDKNICEVIGIDPATWSKIKSGQGYFPQEKYNAYMDYCRNEAPLLWLARSRGYGLHHLETELERQLRETREALAKSEERRQYAESLLVRRHA